MFVTATAFFLLAEGFLQHIGTDHSQQDKCYPVIHRTDGIGKQRSKEETDGRHQRLKAAEPKAAGQTCLQGCFFHCKTLADRNSESIHADTHSQK